MTQREGDGDTETQNGGITKERKNPSIHPSTLSTLRVVLAGPYLLVSSTGHVLGVVQGADLRLHFPLQFFRLDLQAEDQSKTGAGQGHARSRPRKVKVSECLSLRMSSRSRSASAYQRMLSRSSHPSPTPFPKQEFDSCPVPECVTDQMWGWANGRMRGEVQERPGGEWGGGSGGEGYLSIF